MKTYIKYIAALVVCLTFTQCKKSYLDATSPSSVDDNFVTSTTTETFKSLSWCYANYRQNCIMSSYRWNDPVGSDAEYYPEDGSSNNLNAQLKTDQEPVDYATPGFNALYQTLAQAKRLADIIAAKDAYKADAAGGKATDWTQLYGESMTMWAFCYFELVQHFGDVPYGYENTVVTDYSLSSRFTIYDNLISALQKAEPLMYRLGDGSIGPERMSRTFCDALIGEIALYSGGYQTIRTDMSGLYGSVTFNKIGTEAHGCVYARRTDYLNYYKTADTWLQNAITNAGTCHLITADTRGGAINNPFQLHFQYFANLQTSPESLLEIGNIQGGTLTTTSEYPYAFGRPSDGGSANAAPNKTFGALRIVPTVYYGEFDNADHRRDASATVTASNGDGNEKMITFVPGSKSAGGISTNKWDENRMNPPYTPAQRNSGMNWHILRMADVMLMLAEVKAELGEDALTPLNQIRARAYGNASHALALSGQPLKDAIMQERKLELLGEGQRRWDMIRSGNFSIRAIAVQQDMATLFNDLKAQGFHKFANGNVMSNYIYIKKVALTSPLTFDCAATDTTANPAAYPAWRGQYNYSTLAAVASKVVGTTHNVAIQGLFRYIDPAGAEAASLVAAGYTKTNWGIDLVNGYPVYQRNILSGITAPTDPPRYYYALPALIISKSNGKITNGYGLPQQ